MSRDYLQEALGHFNIGKHQWYGWRENPSGDKIELYENLILLDSTATMPTETEVNNKITEIKQKDANRETKIVSAKSKLEALGLTTEEIKEAFGI
jgi:hypothetical protein